MLYERMMQKPPTLRELAERALGITPTPPNTRIRQSAKAAAVPRQTISALVFTVIDDGSDWVLIEREKVGAAAQKKPRWMQRSRLSAWTADMQRNGFEVEYFGDGLLIEARKAA
jgi:hypothetical protein